MSTVVPAARRLIVAGFAAAPWLGRSSFNNEQWAEKIHPVGVEKPMKLVYRQNLSAFTNP